MLFVTVLQSGIRVVETEQSFRNVYICLKDTITIRIRTSRGRTNCETYCGSMNRSRDQRWKKMRK